MTTMIFLFKKKCPSTFMYLDSDFIPKMGSYKFFYAGSGVPILALFGAKSPRSAPLSEVHRYIERVRNARV